MPRPIPIERLVERRSIALDSLVMHRAAAVLPWSARQALVKASLICSLIVVCAVVGGLAGLGGLEPVYLVVLVFCFVVLLMLSVRGVPVALGVYLMFILTFAVGWRQVWLSQTLRFHPSEVILWLAAAAFVANYLVVRRQTNARIPLSVGLLAIYCIIGLATAAFNGLAMDTAVYQAKMLLAIIPVLIVVGEGVADSRTLRLGGRTFSVVAAYIALMGLLEYFVPSAVAPFRGFFGAEPISLTQQGFVRAEFTFYGGGAPTGILLALATIPILAVAFAEKGLYWKAVGFVSAAACALASFLSGMRGAWLAILLALLAYCWLNRQRSWLLVLVIVAACFAPSSALERVLSLNDPVAHYDTSVTKRETRLIDGLALIQSSPIIGHGSGASGLVHSDLVQIGADYGLPAVGFFLWWYLGATWRLYSVCKRSQAAGFDSRETATGLVAGLVAGFVCLNTEAIISLPYVVFPLWYLVATSERIVGLANAARAELPVAPEAGA